MVVRNIYIYILTLNLVTTCSSFHVIAHTYSSLARYSHSSKSNILHVRSSFYYEEFCEVSVSTELYFLSSDDISMVVQLHITLSNPLLRYSFWHWKSSGPSNHASLELQFLIRFTLHLFQSEVDKSPFDKKKSILAQEHWGPLVSNC